MIAIPGDNRTNFAVHGERNAHPVSVKELTPLHAIAAVAFSVDSKRNQQPSCWLA